MATPTKTEETNPNSNPSPEPKEGFFHSPAHLIILLVVFIVLLAGGIFINSNRKTEPVKTNTSATKKSASISMDTDNLKPKNGDIVSVEIWADAASSTVNAVQALINYPTNDFKYVSYDGSNSGFEIQAQATGKSGQITIARGHKGAALSGRQLVGVIKLKTIGSEGPASLTFDPTSALLSSVNNKNILVTKTGLNFAIGDE